MHRVGNMGMHMVVTNQDLLLVHAHGAMLIVDSVICYKRSTVGYNLFNPNIWKMQNYFNIKMYG